MGRKNVLQDFVSVVSGDMSIAPATISGTTTQVSIIGPSTHVINFDLFSYVLTWSGGQTTIGNVGILYSMDNVVWHDLDFGGVIAITGTSGDCQLLVKENPGFSYARPYYARTNSGATGSLRIELSASNKGA